MRELDALGGEMGRRDRTMRLYRSRMLNTGKGPAVHSLRAQADKKAYQLQHAPGRGRLRKISLLRQGGDHGGYWLENGRVTGVETTTGSTVSCRAVVSGCGVYLKQPHHHRRMRRGTAARRG